MSTRMAEETQHLLDALTDEWQLRDEVFERVMLHVPPGRAMRRYEDNYARSSVSGSKKLTGDAAQRSGARAILTASVRTLKDSGKLEVSAGGDCIRRGPAHPARKSPKAAALGKALSNPGPAPVHTPDLSVPVPGDPLATARADLAAAKAKIRELEEELEEASRGGLQLLDQLMHVHARLDMLDPPAPQRAGDGESRLTPRGRLDAWLELRETADEVDRVSAERSGRPLPGGVPYKPAFEAILAVLNEQSQMSWQLRVIDERAAEGRGLGLEEMNRVRAGEILEAVRAVAGVR